MTRPLLAVSARTADLRPERLLTAADAEADAFADRLHDGALQALVVARYAADAAVRGGDVARARDAVQDALVALRREVWLLRPRGEQDLPGALADLSAQRVAAGAPPLDLDLDGAVTDELPPVARAAGYRFVQATAPVNAPCAVRLGRDAGDAGDVVRLSVTGTPADVAGWTARAAALGGRLDTDVHGTHLLLALTRSDPEGDR